MDTHKEPDSQPAKQHGNDDGGFRQIYGRHIKKLAAGILVSLGKMLPKTPVQDKRERMSKDYHRIIKDVYKERSRYIKKNAVIPSSLRLIGKLPVQVLYYRRLFVYTWLVHNYRRKGSLIKFALSPFMGLTRRTLSFLAKFVKGVIKGIWGFVKRALRWVGRKAAQLFKWLGKLTLKGIKTFFSKTYSFVKKCLGRIDKIFNVSKNIRNAFGKVSTFLKDKFEKFFISPFKKGVGMVKYAYKKIKDFVFGIAKKGLELIKKGWNVTKNLVKSGYSKLKTFVVDKIKALKTKLKPITNLVSKGIDKAKTLVTDVKNAVSNVAKAVGTKITQWKDSILSFGKDIKDTGSSVLDTLKKGWGKVKSGYDTTKNILNKYVATPISRSYNFAKKWGTKGWNLAKGMVKGGVKLGKGFAKLGRGTMRLLRKGVKLIPGTGILLTSYFEKQDLDNWLNQLQAAKENNLIGQSEFKKYAEILYMSSGAAVAAEISANTITAATGAGLVVSGVAGVAANEGARALAKKMLGNTEQVNALQDALDKGEALLDEGYQIKYPQQASEELMQQSIEKMKTLVASLMSDVSEKQLKDKAMKEAVEVPQLKVAQQSAKDTKFRVGYNPKVDAVVGMNGGFAI